MRNLLPKSIRLNLVLVVLAGVLPVLLVILISGWQRRNHELEAAKQTVSQIASGFVSQQERLTHGIHQWLSALSMLPEVKEMDPAKCTNLFEDFLKTNPWHGGMVLIRPDGSVIASGTPYSPTANFSNMKHIKGALQNHEFSPGEYTLGRVTRLPVIPFAVPVTNAQGNVICVLSTSLRIEALADFFDLSPLPKESLVGFVDSNGVRLYRSPPKEGFPFGDKILENVWETIQTVDKEATLTLTNRDGEERIFAIRRLRLMPNQDQYLNVFVGIPKTYVIAQADALTKVYLFWTGISLLLSIFLAWIVGKFGIHQPIHKLAAVAQRIQSGDLSARSGFPRSKGSLGLLANALDDMAVALENYLADRKRDEAAIIAATQDFELIFENSQVGIMLLRGGRILARGNQRLADILGYASPNEMTGQGMRLFHLSEEDFIFFGERYYSMLAQGEQTHIEYQLRRKDGSPIWCNISGKAVNPSNLDMGAIWIVDDLSLRKETEEKLRGAKMMAENANQAKSDFLANMSHELRTPLNGVLGMLQLIKTTTLDKEQGEYAEMAIQSGRRLTRLLTDILDLSRIEAGMMVIQFEPLNLKELLKAEESLFLPVVQQSGVELRCQIDPRIPNQLLGDATRLQQVLTNLIGNAFKFIESGHVLVEAYPLPPRLPSEYRILFMVSDTGPGIPDDKLDMIFTPFVQVSQGFGRTHQGAGLGLSICKHLIELMGGNISFDTRVGGGTTVYFCVSFKLSEPNDFVFLPAAESELSLKSGLRILLAEDDSINRLAAIGQLENMGCKVTGAEDGQQVIDLLRKQEFDLVLMDVQMPILNGVDATRAIRSGEAGPDRAGISIIALTAYTMAGDREKLIDLGMDDYVAKPVEMDALIKAIIKVTNQDERPL